MNSPRDNIVSTLDVFSSIESAIGVGIVGHFGPVHLTDDEAELPSPHLVFSLFDICPTNLQRHHHAGSSQNQLHIAWLRWLTRAAAPLHRHISVVISNLANQHEHYVHLLLAGDTCSLSTQGHRCFDGQKLPSVSWSLLFPLLSYGTAYPRNFEYCPAQYKLLCKD